MSHLLATMTASWESYYAHHAVARTLVMFAHIAPLIGGAGFAVTADSEVLRVKGAHHERRYSVLERLRTGHSVVLIGLLITIVSGLLLFAADVDTFLHSRFFWTKMALVALLVANGAFL